MMSGEPAAGDRPIALNPYIGPRPFRPDEQHRFFGRSEEIAVLEGLALAARTTLLFAQSGAGKSSLLQAGLIPSLIRGHMVGFGRRQRNRQKMWVLPVLTVGVDVPPDLDRAEVRNVFVFSALLTLHESSGSALRGRERAELLSLSLADALADEVAAPTADQTSDPQPDTLLIFDQFEELFTRHGEHWQHREGFFKQVAEALERHPTLRVLFSMREDYIAELTPYSCLLPDQLRSQFRLERLRRPAALEAIRMPAEQSGRSFDDDAAELLVTKLLGGADPGTTLAEFVEPVYLQVVCYRLWQQIPEGAPSIRREDVERFADVQQALTEFYEQAVVDTLAHMRKSETALSEIRLRVWFDRQLITPARTRSLVYRDADSQTTGGLPNKAVEYLDYEVHLIRPVVRGKDTWYELIHDRLVGPILRANERWRGKHGAEWQFQAQRWRGEGESADALLNEADLAKAQAWIAAEQYTPEPVELRFLDASRSQVERSKKLAATQASKGTNLAETGWGVIFAADDPDAAAVEQALAPLLELRRGQAGARFHIFSGPEAYRPEESAQDFLARFRISPGVADYGRLPYYLLLVGEPERIPFEVQYGLQSRYAVGRITFQTLDEYGSYARSVVASENGSFSLLPRIALFGPTPADDRASRLTQEQLFHPLLSALYRTQQEGEWEIGEYLGDDADKTRLRDLLGGSQTPAILFSGSHGLTTQRGSPNQELAQGAIFSGGSLPVSELSPELFLSADDIGPEARLLGSVAFLFGGWSAGTPQVSGFPNEPGKLAELALRPFVARLPQRLLGHPQGGMLAVIGHVDESWTLSFYWQGVINSDHFNRTLRLLMDGATVGVAFQPLAQRYHQFSTLLATELQQAYFYGKEINQTYLLNLNRATVDARNFIILGDPAVRVPLENGPLALERPTIEQVSPGFEAQTKGLESTPPAPTRSADEEVLGPPAELPASAADLAEESLAFNGVNGATGAYWTPPITAQELVEIILGERSQTNLDELRTKYRQNKGSF